MSTPAPVSSARDEVRHVIPRLIELSEALLYPAIWERPGPSKRDRSPSTVAAPHRPDQLEVHADRAPASAVTREEKQV